MKTISISNRIISVLLALFCVTTVQAGAPLWTFTPLTATTISLGRTGTATVQYRVTNQSLKSHTLVMTAITGITQTTGAGLCSNPFVLPTRGSSCLLSLQVNGNQLRSSIHDGPAVCEQSSMLQCYRPSAPNVLNISIEEGGETTLTSSVSTLALSVNNPGLNAALTGTPRLITITNTGSAAATNVTYSPSPALPSNTTITPASCGTIAPSETCVLTVTPGDTPSAAPGNTSPTSITLSISGTNTNTLTPTLNILTYGSVYQSGYVYSVNDTTSNINSIGGKVAGLTNVSNSNRWTNATGTNIPGAESNTNGIQNTTEIVANPSCTSSPSNCAAFQCRNNFTAGGYIDWYLPAICEVGFDRIFIGSGCGSAAAPTIQNMQSNLVDNGNVGSLSGIYWSSTDYSPFSTDYAWVQYFASVGGSFQGAGGKASTRGVRCSRALTI